MQTLCPRHTQKAIQRKLMPNRGTLRSYGFSRQQGSVYFGSNKVDAVRTVMAARRLATKYAWFTASVRDIRMLRIEDDNDLMPAIYDKDS